MRSASKLTACLFAGASVLLVGGPASAAPPPGEAFEIRYFTTDGDAERSRQMTALDLQYFVNKARCECGQAVSTRLRIATSTTDLDPVQIRTFVGNRCDEGETSFAPQVRPCALLYDAFTNAYTRNIDVAFNPLWLAAGVSDDSPTRDPNSDDVVAAGSCDRGQGNGGIWICVENGMQTNCQQDEFVVNGTQNLNTTMGATEGEETMGIRFDFEPPIVTVANPRVSAGDGAIEVSWDVTSTGAIDGGFRLLCATADGQPVPGKGFTLGDITAQNNGTIYFTKENLCPDGPFDEVETNPDESTTGLPPPGTTGGTDTGGGTGGSGGFDTTGGAVFEDEPAPQHGGVSDCCAAKISPGCSNAGCQSIVCDGDLDPCCTQGWDQACADEAINECITCGGPATCCSMRSTPGCGDTSCEQQVCIDMPECCKVAWDGTCVSAAQTLCAACMDDTTTGATGPTTDTDGTSVTATATATDTDGTASGTDTDGVSSPIESMGWEYVCSGFMAPASSSGRISGLENGVEYQVLVVAYDRSGNPVPASAVLTATPRETTDLWEQCEQQGGVCGEGGFCNCRAPAPAPDHDAAWLLLLTVFGLRRRRAA
jgi:hypothetical protein